MAFYKLYPRDWNDESWRGETRSVLIVRAGSEMEARATASAWDMTACPTRSGRGAVKPKTRNNISILSSKHSRGIIILQ